MIEIIQDNTPYSEQLAMLAEECTELAQAALKRRRTVEPNASPTNKTQEEAEAQLREEIADVITCLLVLGDYIEEITPILPIAQIINAKIERWVNRIQTNGE